MSRNPNAAAPAAALGLPADGAGTLVRRAGGRVLVELRVGDTTAATQQRLRALGLRIVNVSRAYATITAEVAPTALQSVARDPAVRYVSEVLAPLVGSVPRSPSNGTRASPNVCSPTISEGDAAMNVAAARNANAIDGAGQTVGILSDSFNTDATAPTHLANDVASGDLPGATNPCGHTTPVQVQTDYSVGGQHDEGRAMAQLVHDLAPGANLAFASASNGEFDLANQIDALRTTNHASVIVDDVTYLDEPFFQDGPVANAVNAASAAGVPYFSAAGNFNTLVGGNNVSSYEAPTFRSTACPASVVSFEVVLGCHNFDTTGGTDNGDEITLAPGGSIALDLQWAQPWGAVLNDYDVFLVDSSNGAQVAHSVIANGSSGRPFEFLSYTNVFAQTKHLQVVIAKYSGGVDRRIKFVLLDASGVTNVEYNLSAGGDVVGPSIFGHNGTATVGSTAAIPYDNADTSEDYSSRGPETLYFNPYPSTTALGAPQVIAQPTFAATDNVRTTFFGPLTAGVRRFGGTSAAAPQAAAIGALLRAYDPAITPAELLATLHDTARPVATNGTSDAVGGGYLDANAALASVVPLPGAPPDVVAVNGESEATVQWSAAPTNPNFPVVDYIVTPYLGGVAQDPVNVGSAATTMLVTGLTNGELYTFTVTATNANGDGPVSAPSGSVNLGTPGVPSGVSVVPGDGQAQVTWSPPAPDGINLTGYTVTPIIGGTPEPPQPFAPTSTTQTVTGLTNGTSYTFRVAATDAFTTGLQSVASVAITVGAPIAMSPPKVAPRSGAFVLTWTPPAVNNGATVTTYEVTPHQDATALTPTDFNASTTSATLGGFTNGVLYTFTITASNARGLSPASNASPALAAGAPDAPAAPTTTANGNNVIVKWLPPTITGASSVMTGYTIRTYVGTDLVATDGLSGMFTNRSFSLDYGVTYTFTVAARNSAGDGPESAPSTPITDGAPVPPTAVTATPGNGGASVKWTAPLTGNGAAVTSYTVTPYLAGIAQTPHPFLSAATTQLVTGLTNATAYTFRVTATNSRGEGQPSAASPAVTVGSPLAPATVNVAPGSGQATVSWTAPTSGNGAVITGYVITVSLGLVTQPPITVVPSSAKTITGLTNAKTYTVKVAAKNARGTGPGITTTVTVGAPRAPTAITATAKLHAATIHWTAAANNGAAITSYVITPYLNGVAQTAKTFASAATTQTVTGLTSHKTYAFKVVARNARGSSPQSLPSNAITVL